MPIIAKQKKTSAPRQGLLHKFQKFILGAEKEQNSAHLAQTDMNEAKEPMITVEKIIPGMPIIYIRIDREVIEAHRDISIYLEGNGLRVGDELEIMGYEVGNRPVVRRKEVDAFLLRKFPVQMAAPEANIIPAEKWIPKRQIGLKKLP